MKEDVLEPSAAQIALQSVMDHYGYSIQMILADIGTKFTGRLYDIRRGKTKFMSREVIAALKGKWPELNEGFLHTGRGEMLLAPTVEEKKEELPTTDMSGVILHLVSVIQQQTQAINEMRKELELMKLYVASLQQASRSYYFDNNEQGRKASDDSNKENK